MANALRKESYTKIDSVFPRFQSYFYADSDESSEDESVRVMMRKVGVLKAGVLRRRARRALSYNVSTELCVAHDIGSFC